MNPEEIVQRFSRRPGLKLVSYQEVGLPVWKLFLRVLILAHRDLPPVEEFVLRSVQAGLRRPPEINGLLGLENRITLTAAAALVGEDFLTSVPADETTLALTPRGTQALADMGQLLPQEIMVTLHFDGLTRKFCWLADVPTYQPKDLRELNLREIPPFPQDPPSVEELSIQELDATLKKVGPSTEWRRDILQILSIERRERWYQRGLALVFEGREGFEIQVAFAVDERLSEEHGQAFAEAGGARKLGITQALRQRSDDVALSLLDSETVNTATRGVEVEAIRATTDHLREALVEAEASASKATGPDREFILRQVTDTASKLSEAEAALAELPVRPLEVYEHAPLLHEALQHASERLLIVSPWIRAGVVNADFLNSLEEALKRGVNVLLGYGSGVDEMEKPWDQVARNKLEALSFTYPGFRMTFLGDTHAKVLIMDRDFVVVTSFNWLSFKGDPLKPFRDERGMLVRIRQTIDDLFESFAKRIGSPAG